MDYETLLFNFYEYFALCILKGFVDEDNAKIFFKNLLLSVRGLFDNSVLFKEGYAEESQYRGLQWLFERWNI